MMSETKPLKGSARRVADAAAALGLSITIEHMPDTTRTAEDAAKACGCAVGQIVKSLIFEGADSGRLILLLVSGGHQADMEAVRQLTGEPLKRADPRRVREETGFAIGGVAPIGHLAPLPTLIDEALLTYDRVWAAAGAPNAVFAVSPNALATALGASAVALAAP